MCREHALIASQCKSRGPFDSLLSLEVLKVLCARTPTLPTTAGTALWKGVVEVGGWVRGRWGTATAAGRVHEARGAGEPDQRLHN
jgi:hypothetical protein